MSALPWLDPYDDDQPFPNPERALREPDGLLAVGGSLASARLLRAYREGIFPWYSDGQPILWWSPDPRTVLLPEQVKVSRSLRKTLRRGVFRYTFDRNFTAVVEGCSQPRPAPDPDGAAAGTPAGAETGTWLSAEMKAAYARLYRLGYAHSVEVWGVDGSLLGGLYGVAVGRVFYGESMFSRRSDASKVALVMLCARLRHWGYALIDCQMQTAHLLSMGARTIPRRLFLEALDRFCRQAGRAGSWDDGVEPQPTVVGPDRAAGSDGRDASG